MKKAEYVEVRIFVDVRQHGGFQGSEQKAKALLVPPTVSQVTTITQTHKAVPIKKTRSKRILRTPPLCRGQHKMCLKSRNLYTRHHRLWQPNTGYLNYNPNMFRARARDRVLSLPVAWEANRGWMNIY